MRRAHRWFAAIGLVLLAGCASSPGSGGETSTGEDALWVIFYLAALVAGVVGAKLLVESHSKN